MSFFGSLPRWVHPNGVPLIDPASLNLNGYWARGAIDFTGNPFTIGVTATWRGTASVGTSGGRDATRFLANLPRPPGGAAFPPPPPDIIGASYPQYIAADLSLLNGGALTSAMSTFVNAAAATFFTNFKFDADPSNVGILANNSAIISDAAKSIFVVAKKTAAGVYDVYVSVDGNLSHVQLVGLSVGTWYSLVATFDGATLKVYLDGVLSGTVASGAMGTASTPILGTNSSGTSARSDFVGMGPFVASAAQVSGVYAWMIANGWLVD